MYFDNVSSQINLISTYKFEKDYIFIPLSEEAYKFLTLYVPKNIIKEDLIYPARQLLQPNDPLRAISLYKTNLTSLGDQVNPDFILTLHKALATFLKTVASNWKLRCLEPMDQYSIEDNKSVRMTNLGLSDTVNNSLLKDIININGMGSQITVTNTIFEIDLVGKWGDLKKISNIFRNESLAATKTFPSLSQIVSRHICHRLEKYKKDKSYPLIPTELSAKIDDEAIYCIQ